MLCSVALNLFLLAFLLGRNSLGLMDGLHGHPHPMAYHGEAPANAMGGEYSSLAKHPPFHMTQWLLSQQELEQDRPFVQGEYDKITTMRKNFAQALMEDRLPPESIRKHFREVDDVMTEIKEHFHHEVEDKINAMTPQARRQFAEKLLEP